MKTLSILAGITFVVTALLSVGLANRASAKSANTVVAICGPNSAARLVNVETAPFGCRIAQVNSAPKHR